jgi:hypothetical protein
VTAQVAVAPISSLTITEPSIVAPVSYFHRNWPQITLAIVLLINAAWIGLLGYGVFQLGEMVF